MSAHELPADCHLSVDAAPYLLGALDDREAEAYRLHLAGCAICRREVGELEPVVDLLPSSAPLVAAPPYLGERIMSVVKGEAELLNAAGHAADRPPRRRRSWRPPQALALVAGGALAAGLLVGALISGGGSSVHETHGLVAASGASAVLRQSGGRAELDVSHLAPAPAGRVYQVWLGRPHRPPAPTDALFGVNRSGDAAVAVPGNLHGVTRVMVTSEPAGGSLAPTTQPVITVPLRT